MALKRCECVLPKNLMGTRCGVNQVPQVILFWVRDDVDASQRCTLQRYAVPTCRLRNICESKVFRIFDDLPAKGCQCRIQRCRVPFPVEASRVRRSIECCVLRKGEKGELGIQWRERACSPQENGELLRLQVVLCSFPSELRSSAA